MDASAIKQVLTAQPLALVGFSVGLCLAYIVGRAVYNVYFHPLAHVPGPKFAAISRLPHIRHVLAGTTANETVELHERYGDVVRFSPNEVSFISGETAWPDIYGFRTGKMRGHLTMPKDPVWYAPPRNGHPSILIADDVGHTKGRRILSHAFSAQALASQEELLQSYVDQLVDRLAELSSPTKPVEMVAWFNACTFDVIADLLFGEPFGSLEAGTLHTYVQMVLESFKAIKLFYILHYWPFAKYLGSLIVPKGQLEKRRQFMEWVAKKTEERMARETARPDFITHVQKHNNNKDGEGLSEGDMASNSVLFISAGSETTATLLSGALYLLLTNQNVMQKLVQEVRETWQAYGHINLESVNKAEYLVAVLAEALRMFPPVPTGFQRRVPQGGETVSGVYIPEGTGVCMSSYAAHLSERNFRDPKKFAPERWMGDPYYEKDNRAGCQPFSFGPRNCLGKNLAYAEMRLIMAKLLWSFDFSLEKESQNWMQECHVETLWVKPALMVKIKDIRT